MKKKSKVFFSMAMAVCFLLGMSFIIGGTTVKAASSNRYTQTSYGHYSNGKKEYYISSNTLYERQCSTGKVKKLKKIKASGDAGFTVSGVAKGKVFMTKGSFNRWTYWTYTYNLSTKKFKMVKKNCDIQDIYGSYAVAYKEYRSDVGPYTVTIYKITASGLKKVRTLASSGRQAQFVNGKLYYGKYKSNKSLKSVSLYRCNPNGSNNRKMKTFTSKGNAYGYVYITKFGKGYCEVLKDSGKYRYNYKTKKLRRI